MKRPEQGLFRSVSMSKETLIEWAEHVFRYTFRTYVARGGIYAPA
jgi:hypothetical protein